MLGSVSIPVTEKIKIPCWTTRFINTEVLISMNYSVILPDNKNFIQKISESFVVNLQVAHEDFNVRLLSSNSYISAMVRKTIRGSSLESSIVYVVQAL